MHDCRPRSASSPTLVAAVATLVGALLVVVMLVGSTGCEEAPPEQASLVHPQLGGGMLYGSWSPTHSARMFFVGGGESDSCNAGVRTIVEFDGYGWKFLKTAPDAPDGGTLPDAGAGDGGGAGQDGGAPPDTDGGMVGCPCGDGGTGCPGPTYRAGALRAIYGFTPQEFFAAGQDGALLRVRTTGVEEMPLDTDEKPYFKALWGSAPNDLWAVGGQPRENAVADPRIYRFDGTRWSRWNDVPPGASDLIGMWGARPDRVWAVGKGGTIIYFDGASWRLQPAGSPATSEDLTAIHGRSESDVYVVGGFNRPILLHYDGSVWREIKSRLPGSARLLSVRVFDTRVISSGTTLQSFPDELVLGGIDGVVAHGSPDNLTLDPRFQNMLAPRGVGVHTIVPFFTNGYMLAGGNVFDVVRTSTFGTIMAIGTDVTDSMEARTGGAGGDFPAGAPPAMVTGGGGGTGW